MEKIQISYFKTCLIKVRKESGNRISVLYNLADFNKVWETKSNYVTDKCVLILKIWQCIELEDVQYSQ